MSGGPVGTCGRRTVALQRAELMWRVFSPLTPCISRSSLKTNLCDNRVRMATIYALEAVDNQELLEAFY